MPGYTVILMTKRAEKGLRSFPRASQKKVQQIIDEYLAQTPLKSIPGKTKRLRGRLANFIQYDISYKERLRYEVDREHMTVYVDYIGPHP